jgi:4-aminobutyrate aminotransferase-like enzyme/Ser/Thr protein kinase RdoA (MazF antagonist)
MSHLPEYDASRLVADLYGLRMTARPLPGEYDDNFQLIGDDGRAFVLKVMRVGQSAEVVDLQCRALAHLAERAPALDLPRVCPTLAGEPFATVAIQGAPRLIWQLSYVPGRILAETSPHSAELLHSIGRLLGQIDAALTDFAHPAAQRALKWDLARAGWIRAHLGAITDPAGRAIVERCLIQYENEVAPALAGLRAGVIHNDANDYNLLVSAPDVQPRQAVSVIDFGDMLLSKLVCEPAIAAAYALLGKRDPLAAAAQVVAGYHSAFPLTEAELALLFPLIRARLAVSVTNSAQRKLAEPDDPYITISEAPAWAALAQLDAIHPRFAHYTFRHACGLPPVPDSAAVADWLQANSKNFAPVLDIDLRTASSRVFDLSVGSLFLGADPSAAATPVLGERIFRELRAAGIPVGVGRYDEARLIYATPAFAAGARPIDERRTIHLGIDLFVEAGAPVYAPLAGEVYLAVDNAARLDYGPLVILKHTTDAGRAFFTLYGHLGADALDPCRAGRLVARGERIGSIGAPPRNGDWPPHLHFQIITDLLDLDRDFPGVAYASQRAVWNSLSPDPNQILGIPAERFPAPEPSPAATLAARQMRIGRNLSISYQQPLKFVRGWMQYLYDETGRAFLDVYNNVPIVGHSHPRVVQAAQAQLALLNTNTRYLHDNLTRYAERLTALMPDPLTVCFILNSASEANELALRLARTYTGHEHLIVLDAAYHGHTGGLIDISPYKFNGPGGGGPKPWVHIAPIPDDYRGVYKRNDPAAGTKYAGHVGAIVDRLQATGQGLVAYIAETLPSVGGQIVFPPGYLAEAYRYVRAAGGLCIADEVQVGFGRLGTHFWGFETQGVVPDIVVLGKPIGNGFPLAAVVTTPAIAAAFDNGMEFFSTFGGNPVACAAGLAVLDVLRDERLQDHALRVGSRLLAGLRELIERHPIIGDARGSGLFLGVELVRDRATLEPAAEAADYLVNRLRYSGILAGTDGPLHNVIKIRPPLPFGAADADLLLETLDELLREDVFQLGLTQLAR